MNCYPCVRNRPEVVQPNCTRIEPTVKEWTRFKRRISETESGCWIWTGSKAGYKRGYGAFQFRGALVLAHRFSYRVIKGDIPHDRPQLDHLCRTPACANP